MAKTARGLGKGIREFKRAADDVKREIMIDPDLNLDLDLNEPLSKGTNAIDDPYKQDDWENDDSEAVKQSGDSEDETEKAEDKVSEVRPEADVHRLAGKLVLVPLDGAVVGFRPTL